MTTAESTLAVISRLGRAQLEQTLRRAARMMGRSRPEPLALGDIGYPDTATALEAASLLRAHAPGVLAAHCYRTYLFGATLGNPGRPRLGRRTALHLGHAARSGTHRLPER